MAIDRLIAQRMQGSRTSAVRELLKHSKAPGMISLGGGIPAPDLFDIEGLHSAINAELTQDNRDAFQYTLTEGDIALRHAICDFLPTRHIEAHPGQLLTTTGSQQALDLITRVLVNPGDTLLVARPSYLAALQLFQQAQAQIGSLPTTADNRIAFDRLDAMLRHRRVKAIYVVANFNNPSSATLTLEERQGLLEIAVRHQVMIIEDDPYGELRLEGRALPPIYALAQQQSAARDLVIYVSSFSKILSPGLRAGWLVTSSKLYDYLVIAKQAADLHTCTLSQKIVLHYLTSQRLGPWLETLIAAYRERRDALCQALDATLGDTLSFSRPEGGMFIWASLPAHMDSARLLPFALEEKVAFVPGAPFFADQPEHHRLRLSYTTITEVTATQAAERLANAYARYCADEAVQS